eukprot:gene7866-biopygen22576
MVSGRSGRRVGCPFYQWSKGREVEWQKPPLSALNACVQIAVQACKCRLAHQVVFGCAWGWCFNCTMKQHLEVQSRATAKGTKSFQTYHNLMSFWSAPMTPIPRVCSRAFTMTTMAWSCLCYGQCRTPLLRWALPQPTQEYPPFPCRIPRGRAPLESPSVLCEGVTSPPYPRPPLFLTPQTWPVRWSSGQLARRSSANSGSQLPGLKELKSFPQKTKVLSSKYPAHGARPRGRRRVRRRDGAAPPRCATGPSIAVTRPGVRAGLVLC